MPCVKKGDIVWLRYRFEVAPKSVRPRLEWAPSLPSV